MFKVVRQRPGAPDCALACYATIAGRSYEEAARMFGIPLDAAQNPIFADSAGLHMFATIYAYFNAGHLPVCLVSQGAAQGTTGASACATSEQIKSLLPETLAVLGYNDAEAGDHAVIWDGSELIFCDYNTPDPAPQLADLEITGAILLYERTTCV